MQHDSSTKSCRDLSTVREGRRQAYTAMSTRASIALASLIVFVVTAASSGPLGSGVHAQTAKAGVPQYEVHPSWPPKLPNNCVMGVPTWVAVDRHDHVFVLHRPRTVPA